MQLELALYGVPNYDSYCDDEGAVYKKHDERAPIVLPDGRAIVYDESYVERLKQREKVGNVCAPVCEFARMMLENAHYVLADMENTMSMDDEKLVEQKLEEYKTILYFPK